MGRGHGPRLRHIGPVTRFDTADYDVHIAAEVRDFDATEHGITKKEARRFERFVQYAIVASDEALAQSGLNLEAEDTARIVRVRHRHRRHRP